MLLRKLYIVPLAIVLFLAGCFTISSPPPQKTHDGPVLTDQFNLLGGEWQEEKPLVFEKDKCQDHTLEELSDWDIEIDENCYINWLLAIKRGDITPEDSLEKKKTPVDTIEEKSFIIFQPKASVGDVIFSHEIHTYWLGCEGCHYGRRIFIPRRGANPITMKKIVKGEYCGVCHGPQARSSSFNMLISDNCSKCHQEKKDIY